MEKARMVDWKLGLSYSLPNYGLALMVGPAMGILHGYLAKNFKMTLFSIGLVFIVARLWDAITDPIVGIASDKLRNRFWGRRSWLVAGVLVSLLAICPILVWAERLTPGLFCVLMLLCFLGWTLAEIPYLAWGTEIAGDYDERTRLFSYKAAMGYFGSLVYLVLPILIMWSQVNFLGVPVEKTTLDYSPLSMKITFIMLVIVMPLGTLIALSVCPDGDHIRKPEHKTLGQTVQLLLANKAMLVFTGAFVLLGVGCGMQVGLAYLHLTVYLGVKNASTIYFFAFMCSLMGVPFWNWFASRKGKHVAFFTGLAITIFFFIGLALMKPAETDVLYYGQPKVFWQYLITICCLNFCQVVFVIMPPAIIGDIANADMVESKQDETGTYYSIYTFCFKTVLGLGQGMALLMAGPVFGFDPEAKTQTDLAATGLALFMGWIPAGLTLAGALLMTRYPITRERYEEIQQKLKTLEIKKGG